MGITMLVSKWGNSLAVRLPKKLVEDMGLVEGDEVDVKAIDAQTLAITRHDAEADFVIKLRLLQKPTPEGFRWSRDEANER
jgi:antitoxin MazE